MTEPTSEKDKKQSEEPSAKKNSKETTSPADKGGTTPTSAAPTSENPGNTHPTAETKNSAEKVEKAKNSAEKAEEKADKPAPAAAPPPPAASTPPPPPTAAPPATTTPETTPAATKTTQATAEDRDKPKAPNPGPSGSAENATIPPQPLELQAGAGGKEDVGAFKKLFWKINEKVGKVKTSEFSKEYMAAVTEFDTYNALLKDLIKALTSVIQQNPDYVPDEEKRRSNIDAPAGDDPFEMLAKAMETYAPVSSEKKELMKTIETAKKVASHHREYQQRARRSFHQIRTFLKVDVEFMNVERTEVVKCRQHFDIANHEMEKNPGSSWKRSGLERARKAYDAQVRKVIDYVRQMAEKRAQHRIELLRFLQEYRNFSEFAAKEFEKYAAVLAKIPPNPSNVQSPSTSTRSTR